MMEMISAMPQGQNALPAMVAPDGGNAVPIPMSGGLFAALFAQEGTQLMKGLAQGVLPGSEVPGATQEKSPSDSPVVPDAETTVTGNGNLIAMLVQPLFVATLQPVIPPGHGESTPNPEVTGDAETGSSPAIQMPSLLQPLRDSVEMPSLIQNMQNMNQTASSRSTKPLTVLPGEHREIAAALAGEQGAQEEVQKGMPDTVKPLPAINRQPLPGLELRPGQSEIANGGQQGRTASFSQAVSREAGIVPGQNGQVVAAGPVPDQSANQRSEFSSPVLVTAETVAQKSAADTRSLLKRMDQEARVFTGQAVNHDGREGTPVTPEMKGGLDLAEKSVKMVRLDGGTGIKTASEIGAGDGPGNPAITAQEGQKMESLCNPLSAHVAKSPVDGAVMLHQTGTGTPIVLREEVVSQVREGIVQQAGKGDGQINLRLHPEQLGSLQISVRLEDQQLKVNVTAENRMVKDILMENLTTLRETLAKQDLTMGSFTVLTTGQDSRQSFQEGREAAQARSRITTARQQEVAEPSLLQASPYGGAREDALVDLLL